MKKTLAGLAILIALAGFSGCQRGIEPKVEAKRVVTFEASAPCSTDSDCERKEKTPKERHYCAGITKEGLRCRKPVKHEGDYCWMHANQDKRSK